MNGIIIIDKPEGWTSHDVCAKLRGQISAYIRNREAAFLQDTNLRNREPNQLQDERIRNSEPNQLQDERIRNSEPNQLQDEQIRNSEALAKQASRKTIRVGHSGTLDPMATGVLPVFIGRATRAAEFCENAEKEYIAGIKTGLVTDTQDVTGNVLSSCDVIVTEDEITDILPRFLGEQKQTPPMYSAVKHNGAKLYELARRGVEVERKARDIIIKEIELLEAAPGEATDVTHYPAPGAAAASGYLLRVVCSKGTYIRTLCHDIGAALGCGAVMSSLRRTRAGDFAIEKAHKLEEVLGAFSGSSDLPDNILLPIDTVFRGYPAITVSKEDTMRIIHGAQIRMQESESGTHGALVGMQESESGAHGAQIRTPGSETKAKESESGMYRVYSPNGDFLMLAEATGGKLKAVKTFYEPEA